MEPVEDGQTEKGKVATRKRAAMGRPMSPRVTRSAARGFTTVEAPNNPKKKAKKAPRRATEYVEVPPGGMIYEQGNAWENSPAPPTRIGKGNQTILRVPTCAESEGEETPDVKVKKEITFVGKPHTRFYHVPSRRTVQNVEEEPEEVMIIPPQIVAEPLPDSPAALPWPGAPQAEPINETQNMVADPVPDPLPALPDTGEEAPSTSKVEMVLRLLKEFSHDELATLFMRMYANGHGRQ